MNFTALDFETANSYRKSACSIGLVKVRNGIIVDKYYSLIKPEPFWFHPINVSIHGITKESCLNAPTFDELWNELEDWIDDEVIVGHNVSFERSVINHLSKEYGVDINVREYLCSLYLSRVAFPHLDSHRLPNVYAEINNNVFNHHNALDDAIASAEIVMKIVSDWNPPSFEGMIKALYEEPTKKRTNSKRKPPLSSLTPDEGFENNNLYKGKVFTFTGELNEFTKEEAAQFIVNRGGKVTDNVTKATNHLVCGTYSRKYGQDYKSSKLKNAEKLISQGQKITFLTEDDFLTFAQIPKKKKPVYSFSSKNEAHKAFNSLKGIIEGVSIDSVVNEKEIEELRQWTINHEYLSKSNPFDDLIINIQAVIEDGIVTDEEIADMKWLCDKFSDGFNYYDATTSDLQVLQGICHGILSDGSVSDSEVFELKKWLDKNQHLKTYYPYDEILRVLNDVLQDGVVDEEERILLKKFFSEFVTLTDTQLQQQINEDGEEVKVGGICVVNPEIVINNKRFCFTGTSVRSSRSEIASKVKILGGEYNNAVSGKTNYLIVGDNGNPSWAYACYGRKVEKAIELQRKNKDIQIVHEKDFWKEVEKLEGN